MLDFTELDEMVLDLAVDVYINDLLMRPEMEAGVKSAEVLDRARKQTANYISQHVIGVIYEIDRLKRDTSVSVAERIHSA